MDLEKIPPVDCLKALLLVLEAVIEDEEVQVRLSPLPVWPPIMECLLTTIIYVMYYVRGTYRISMNPSASAL